MSQTRSKSRRVIDFSDIENSWTILQDNQNPFSTHYNDQAEIYNAGFRKMMLNKRNYKNSTKLIFIPAK
jgi:penicillin amidase